MGRLPRVGLGYRDWKLLRNLTRGCSGRPPEYRPLGKGSERDRGQPLSGGESRGRVLRVEGLHSEMFPERD